MIDLDAATRIVSEHLAAMERCMNDFGAALPGHADKPQLHLVVTSTTEYEFGWLFAFSAKEYLETGDVRYALAGNAPLIVDRQDGQLYVTGTAHPVDHYLSEYRNGVRRRA
jgi:hypothetical protein